ncbi:pericentrin isoform X4 [Sciurus carolinensis]|uniref:pericentrin isoform X4 n=1 Tax=Sciurus carolinensis TaxID=30640 RepID=UPI001FB33C14|nr:pericentrin isoform X4 [Sciurus carolinensis]
MDEDEQEQRRRKVEAGRAKLAHFRQRKTKGDCTNSKKKTSKRKGSAVDASVPEEGPLAPQDSGHLGGGDLGRSTSCSLTPDAQRGACAAQEEEHDCELASGSETEAGRQQQPQTAPSLELEALRLSLSNMHTAQLELTQANLQREKETALTELREMLNGRRAQELALLQSRQQCELELVREQHAREKEAMALRCGQETAELKEKLQSEMEKSVQMLEALKQDWESERELCLENLRKELSAKHQSEIENLQNQFQKELAGQKTELEKIFQAKNQAEVSLKNLEAQHQAAIRQLREDLQAEHRQCLEDLESRSREREKGKQLELENLQASYEDLKAQSQEEVKRLWSQLESARTSREELNGSLEPLLARASCLEELEHLRRDFAQQQQRDRSQHESELEQLRVYFEKKLRDAEKTYQEDLTLFQQRLQEAKEEFPLGSEEVSSSCTFLEDMSDGKRKEHSDQLDSHLGQQKMGPEAWDCSLHIQHEDPLDRCLLGPQVLELEPLQPAPADQHGQENAQVCLRCVQDATLEEGTQVAARVLALETEHKVRLSLLQTELKEEIELLRIENRNLQERLQHETRLKEDLERVKRSLVEDHQEELNKAEQKVQLLKQEFRKKEVEWELLREDLRREAEENLASTCRVLREKAESEKRSVVSRFSSREARMRHLQDQQAAQIQALEKSLVEQQGRLRQLEQALAGDEALPRGGCGQEAPVAPDGERGVLLQGTEECALQLMQAQNRFLEERQEIMEKFAAEQDAFLQDAQQKHTHELQLLQQGHQQQLLALRTELESRHQAELAKLAASLEREQQVQLEARVAELQMKHAAEISALETRHLSSLDALESCYLSGVQAIQDQHRQALELLRAELEEQLQKKESSHQAVLTQELEKLKLKHEEELQSAKESLRMEMRAKHAEQPKALATELQGVHQEELAATLRDQRHLLEEERVVALGKLGAEALFLEVQQQTTLQQLGDTHAALAEVQPQQAEQAKLQELQAPQEQAERLKGQVLSLHREVEECRAELERLQQRRERENQEGAALVSMLRVDVDLSQSERGALRDALRRLLGVFGETLKAAIALKSRIDERVGLFLDHADAGQAPPAAPPLEEMWSDAALLELDRALPEGAEVSSVAEISSHVCESFFMSPESTLECEQPIRRVYQSLGMAVDGLLEMALDSSRQLEEARQIHSRFEKEFNHKNEETAQALQKHHELLQCLREQRAAKAELALELHRAEGLLEGFKVEKADLQEALGRKEESEQQLVLELESLGRQLEQAAQEQAALREERSILWSQRETWAAEAEAREAALRKEVESLTREQVEAREQAEKDRAALLSQMQVLESELEEQLSQHRVCARQVEEATALKQQLAALDKQLRSQRQFMDEQAAEREHEREEFQHEIQRLEGLLRQVAGPRPPGPRDDQRAPLEEEIEQLQEKLREKSDGFNELVIKKELADRQVLIQEEEIKHLEETNANTRRQVAQLQEELEKQKKMVKKLQDEEALKEHQRRDLLLVSLPQSQPPEGPEVLSEAAQRVLLQRERQVLDLKEQLEKMKNDLVSKNEEILLLNLKLNVQSDPAATRDLGEESASSEVEYSRSSEVEELRAIIETLQENQKRLQKDKAEEIEQLHEVIEKLQSELSLMGPVVHELSDSQVGSLCSELLCSQTQGPAGQVLQAELEAACAAKEALGQLLADQEREHSEALEALQQRLQAAEEAAALQLAELGRTVALREAEVQGMASRIQELEAILKAREATIAQRDLEIGAMNQRKAAHSTELEAVLLALTRFRRALEQQPLAAPKEPPELQRLRVQCVRLSCQLQALSQRFLRCQAELGKQQACVDAEAVREDWLEQRGGGPHSRGPQGDLQPAKVLVTLKDAGLHKPESAMSVLTVCQRQLEAELLLVKDGMRLSAEDAGRVPVGTQGKNKRLEDGQLQKFDLIAQVKQLQKKLNRLVRSMAFQDMDPAGSEPQQPLAAADPSENSSGGSSCDGEAAGASPPVDACDATTSTWGLVDVIKSRDSFVGSEMLYFSIQEALESQDGPLSSRTSEPGDSCHAEEAEPEKDLPGVLDLSSWSSPEALRKDATLEPQPGFPLTPCSGTLSLPSAVTSPQPGADSLLQADTSGLHCYPGGSAAGPAPQWAAAPPTDHHHHRESTAAEKDVEDFIATASNSQDTRRSSLVGLTGDSDGSEHSGGQGIGVMLSPEVGGPEAPVASPATPAIVSRGSREPPRVMKEKEVHPQHMKALLQMVCDESHQILALSESRDLPSTLSKGEPWASLDHFSNEGQGLLEVAPKKGEKESSDTHHDWRGQFLQAVQEALEREREVLKAELQSGSSGPDLKNCSFLFERLEKVVQEQGDLQEKAQQHQRLQDRSSLLSEVQALRAQLRLTHLQNQEKLQQLCAALTSAEARGSQREHQLRRQGGCRCSRCPVPPPPRPPPAMLLWVELLAYKVEQEKCIASDLQKTLSKEQETASDVRRLLAVEQSAAQDLKSENERLLESLGEAQRESLQLRSLLDGKESDLKAALEELESERGKARVLQAQQEEQHLQHLQREGQSAKALEELKVSLEKQHAQNNQLCIALKHERMAKDNLQQELQIEHSRCEALLAQERSQLSQLQESLEAERSRSRELSEALQHERVLTEQLSRSVQETAVQHALLRKLKEEKARVQELQTVLTRVQQQALHTQQQLEAQAQEHRVQLRRQQEVSATLRLAVDTLQTQSQSQELRRCLESRREKPAWLQAESEQSHTRAREHEARKEGRRRTQRPSQADAAQWKTWRRDKERLRELELQRQRDAHKMEQLQQAVRGLLAEEEAPQGDGPRPSSLEMDHLQGQRQELERIRQQLLCAAGLLASFVSRTVDRTIHDWTLSNEKAVSSLVQTLQGLKAELSTPTSSQKKTAAELLQVQLVDLLLQDNSALTSALSTAAREEAELRRAVSRLERTLRHHTQKGCILSRSGRSAWKQEKTAPRSSDSGQPALAASEEADTSHVKMEKLYLHYLRAESFRKALIYQKKYLLLLIGGFQDSEQETLSMIAHLGVFPSKAEKKGASSRPFTRFRTAVRVVIAVLRLRFLVKKWQEVDGKGAPRGRAPRPGPRVPRQQLPPPETRATPSTQDQPSDLAGDSARGSGPEAAASPSRQERSAPSPNSKLERALAASQDSEHSLTEYIHHLEMIQQRLGGAPPDSTSKKSCRQKIKQ